MQNTPVTPTNVETNDREASIEGVLHALPQELLGVIPENVWTGLSVDQKKEILRQNNLLEKYSGQSPEAQAEEPSQAEQVASPDVVVEQVQRPEAAERAPEFAQAVQEVQKIEQDVKEDLDVDEQARVDAEVASQQSSAKGSWGAKIFGYTVRDDTVQNAEDISKNGDLEDGRTWVATLIGKILAALSQ